jgi:hypothetical protein
MAKASWPSQADVARIRDTKEHEISVKWFLVPRCFFDAARFSLFRSKPPKRPFGCAEMKNCT